MTIIVSWAGHGFVAYLNLATLHSSGFDSNDAIGQCLIKLIVLRIRVWQNDKKNSRDVHHGCCCSLLAEGEVFSLLEALACLSES